MKIFQVCHKYLPTIGDVGKHLRNTSERPAREREVAVSASDPSGNVDQRGLNDEAEP
ncbi:MAG: hypothetical protein KAV87_25300 [Desulfobacteraceae bacterium]|nr:hypothetical protein [Desulfobacteraceae bacterium]